MDKAVWDQMPDSLKQFHHCYFKDRSGTEYLIRSVESDTSQLYLDDNYGTCLNPSLPRTFEVRVYEVVAIMDKPEYFDFYGISGQFNENNIHRMTEYYGVELDEILANKVNPVIH